MSAELSIKATISFLGFSFPETHELRKLLSLLSSLAMKEEIQDFTKRRRGEFFWKTLELEDSTCLWD
jgi:HEPN domain-containing protein